MIDNFAVNFIPCKMKYWREYYSQKHFGGMNIGDLDKTISYMYICAYFAAWSYFNVHVLPYLSGIVDMEAKAPLWNICLYLYAPSFAEYLY